MDRIPPDDLAIVFGYLDALSCLRYRAVCKYWRKVSGIGCAFVRVKYGTIDAGMDHNIGSITLVGHNQEKIDETVGKDSDEDKNSDTKVAKRRVKRTCGRLPRPNVLVQEGEDREPASVTFLSVLVKDFEGGLQMRSKALAAGCIPTLVSKRLRGDRAAVRIERTGQATKFQSLDLEASAFEESWRACAGHKWMNCVAHPGPLFDEIIETSKPRLLKKVLIELDLSGLRHLQRLSVRGCCSLEVLCLPPCLTGLDASACSELRQITMPAGTDHSLVALNLNGCRSLQAPHSWEKPLPPSDPQAIFGPSTGEALKSTRELDMSWVNQQEVFNPAFVNALRMTLSLVTVSLRYVAIDTVLLALAESTSAQETLLMVDVAFSSDLSDVAVEKLVRSAPKLERLNMRGCRKVSAECYNDIPVFLEKRSNGGETDFLALSDERNGDQKRRKGDNIFYFVGKQNPSNK